MDMALSRKFTEAEFLLLIELLAERRARTNSAKEFEAADKLLDKIILSSTPASLEAA